MGKLGYFLGGALLGAAGLTAAAFLTRDKDAEGNTTIHYHCDGCNQDFTIGFDVEEE